MVVDRIKVSIEGYGLWGGMEASIAPGENPVDEWVKLKELVQLAMGQSDSMKGTVITQSDDKLDEQFEELKARLAGIEFYEDAKSYLDSTDFKHTMEAKIIINAKKRKA